MLLKSNDISFGGNTNIPLFQEEKKRVIFFITLLVEWSTIVDKFVFFRQKQF